MVHKYLERIRCLFGSIEFIEAAKMGFPKIECSGVICRNLWEWVYFDSKLSGTIEK